jgi:hypothetical protein
MVGGAVGGSEGWDMGWLKGRYSLYVVDLLGKNFSVQVCTVYHIGSRMFSLKNKNVFLKRFSYG